LTFPLQLVAQTGSTTQITRIILDGIAQGEFATADPGVAGRAVLTATTRFHHPAHAAEWSDPDLAAEFEGVWTLILVGLCSRASAQA